jgi:hypothetical protein
MNNTDFTKLVDDFCEEIKANLITKGGEYSPLTDRLQNFKDAAKFLGETNEMALLGFVTKHIIALKDFIVFYRPTTKEQWKEKTVDICCYMFLLRALLTDRGGL